MSKTETGVVTKEVALDSIIPDADQPRKNFDAARIGQLVKSIEKHGIMNPLVVEALANNKFILVDGERRYRAAKEMGLKKVPVNIIKNQGATERLIRQFHLQEQHEGWSAIEKAKGVIRLAKELKLTVQEVGTILSLPERTIKDYMAYGELLAEKEFSKSDIPIHYAGKIVTLRRAVRKAFEKKDEEFTREDEEALERAVIARMKKGDIQTGGDIIKIRDAANTDHKTIRQFMRGNLSVQKLFLESNAKAAAHYRNAMYSANFVHVYISKGLPLGIKKLISTSDKAKIERAIQSLKTLL